jgi:hypothetical protein
MNARKIAADQLPRLLLVGRHRLCWNSLASFSKSISERSTRLLIAGDLRRSDADRAGSGKTAVGDRASLFPDEPALHRASNRVVAEALAGSWATTRSPPCQSPNCRQLRRAGAGTSASGGDGRRAKD